MPFKKGESGNANGRPKGALNKVSPILKEKLKDITDIIADDLLENPEQLLKLSPSEKLKALGMLSEYNAHKLSRGDNAIKIDLDKTSDEKIEELFDKALSRSIE